MLDLVTLGRRLKDARLNCGVTQEAAADAIGAPRTAIVHIEAGNRSLSTMELAELAKLYGRPIASFLADDENQEKDFLVALNRLSAEWKNSKILEREIRRWVDICREGAHLAAMLQRESRFGPPAYDLPAPGSFAAAVEQGEKIAEEERHRQGLGNAPIPDMAELLSSQGIWAAGAELSDEMSGLFLHQHEIGLVVLVNFGHSRGRKRFSYAHEFAHSLFDRKRAFTVTTKKNSTELVEKRANAFAASFLVPKAGVEMFLTALNKGGSSRRSYHIYDVATEEGIEAERRTLASSQEISFRDVALLAAHFGVSYQVAVYRLGDLSYINREALRALLEKQDLAVAYLKLIGKWKNVGGMPTSQDRELVSQILPLAIEAYRREEISKGKLLDLSKQLGVKGAELAALA